LSGARDGDEQAFSVLWWWLHPALIRWLGVVAPGGADDVESETWISVLRGLDAFEGGEPEFRGWVFTIARRRAIDWARRHRRHATASLVGIDRAIASDATESVWSTDALEAAVALLRTLKPDQAEVVALRVIVGMTVTETAAVVRKSEGAVRVLCHRGLRAMARALSAEATEAV
jgi:RNA polymerase sigma-70 factor (ECF subfamily)